MKMPARKQPPSLKAVALAAAQRVLTYQVRVVMSTSALRHDARLAWLCDALTAVPEEVRPGLVAATLSCTDNFFSYRNNHPARRVLDKLLSALLPHSLRRLVLHVDKSYPLREALLRRLQALPLLRELTLSESLRLYTSEDAVVEALSALRQLRVLRAPWVCSDAVTEALGKHCHLLEFLDASESARVTDASVAALTSGCPALRVVLLTGCKVSARGYADLLAGLPLLQRIGRCPSLGGVLRTLPAPTTPGLALVEWDSDHPPGEADAALCPELKVVSLSDVSVLPAQDGAVLPRRVERLRVCWVGVRDHAVRVALRLTADLTHLDMTTGHEVTLGDAVELGRQCPSLRVLKLTMLHSDVGVGAVPVHPAKDAPFRRLEEFCLYSGPGPLLEYVLLHATALRTVYVAKGVAVVAPWTDAAMRRVMAVNPLSELTSFVLACPCDLTKDSVYLLLLGCPKLRTLMDLSEWKLSESQLAELLEVVAVNNWDLNLGHLGLPAM